jgi:hypothetical protein
MDTVNVETAMVADPHTEAARLAWEADRIAEARAELDAGYYVDAEEIAAWVATIGTAHELPPPPTRFRAPD